MNFLSYFTLCITLTSAILFVNSAAVVDNISTIPTSSTTTESINTSTKFQQETQTKVVDETSTKLSPIDNGVNTVPSKDNNLEKDESDDDAVTTVPDKQVEIIASNPPHRDDNISIVPITNIELDNNLDDKPSSKIPKRKNHLDIDRQIITQEEKESANSSLEQNSVDSNFWKNETMLIKLCEDLMKNNETCHQFYTLLKDEQYLTLTFELTHRILFQTSFGIVLLVLWSVILSVLNFIILFLCTLLKPLRSFLLTKIISDLRRRYYFTSDSTEMRIIDNGKK